MEYNTTRESIPITEYGRNVKKMIDYTITVDEREKRNRMAKQIVNIMSQVNLQSRDNNEFKHKIWDHLFILSDFKLDIDSPYPPPVKIDIDHRPEKIAYPTYNIAFKHYGNNIEKIINKGIEMEEGQQKEALILTIANHLKKSYLTWNRDSVTDEVIADHLEMLSGGKLKLAADAKLSETRDILANNKRKSSSSASSSRRTSGSFSKNRPRTIRPRSESQNQSNNDVNGNAKIENPDK